MQLSAKLKTASGTGAARATRREDRVPAIVYGKNFQPVQISLGRKEIVKALHTPGFRTRLINLQVEQETYQVLARDVQFHPVTDVPQHLDFQRVGKDDEVRVEVPVAFINSDKSPGIKRGGVLNIVRHEIEFFCKPASIPEKIVVDLSGTKIGQSIHINDIPLGEGIRPSISRNFTIATIAGAASDKDEAVEGGSEGGAAATPTAADAKKPEAKK